MAGSEITEKSSCGDKSSILDEIDRQMSDLQVSFVFLSAELERDGSYSPPPLPPPEHQPMMNLQKPSLPEPEGPPPPPPVQNGYAFSSSSHYTQETQKAMNTLKRNKSKPSKPKEPIYESIKPRPEPVGGSGNSPPASEYRSFCPPVTNNIPICSSPRRTTPTPPPPATPPDNQYGFGNMAAPPPEQIYQSRRETQTRTRKRSSSGSPGPVTRLPVNNDIDGREQRKMIRVRRELEKIQEVEEERVRDLSHDLVEFAENFFNDHEKSPPGTIVGTIKRSKTMEVLPKSEMVTFSKSGVIPTSHIHMFDPENVTLACSMFRDLVKYCKGELRGDQEVTAIQHIVQQGLEREELRDEIYVQCIRQLTNNPSADQIERLWLLLCLVVVAFPTGKTLHRYFLSFLQLNLSLSGKCLQYVQWCLDHSNRAQAATRIFLHPLWRLRFVNPLYANFLQISHSGDEKAGDYCL